MIQKSIISANVLTDPQNESGILTHEVYAGSVNREACMGQAFSQMEYE